MHEPKPMDPKVKNYVNLEWSLVYVEEDGVLLLIFAKSEGKRKMLLGKMFTYGVRNRSRPQPSFIRKWKKQKREYDLCTYTERRRQLLMWKP